jgi:N-acylglucosamine-6-phosphate 2-epimerase
LDCPVVAEGRIRTTEDVRAVFDAGAYAVVVGHAITDPTDITARLVSAIPARW